MDKRVTAVAALAAFVSFAAIAAEKPVAGKTTAKLEGPYEDRLQSQVNFGQRSFYLAPWRAYMDTWPVSRWFEIPGVNFGGDTVATATVLSEAGFRSARVEWGWGNMAWDNPGHFSNEPDMKRRLRAIKDGGMRPLILLNAHHGVPCAIRWFNAKLVEDAPAGQRSIVLEKVDNVRPRYCGLTNLNDYRALYPIIDSVDPATGRCELSAPLPVDLKAGDITLSETRVRPLSGSVNADGTPNPDCAESLVHWMEYIATACRVAKEALGTTNETVDVGFDIEVWNEYTFGSCFLDINNYCDPRIEFKEPIIYRDAAGHEARGPEAIFPMTVDYIRNPENKCPGVTIVNGFANQRPWDNLTERWPGVDAISRHYYSAATPRIIDADHPDQPNNGPINALGEREGNPDGRDWHTVDAGSFFIPSQRWACPESSHFAFATEYMTRDTLPFPSTSGGPVSFAQHHRYGHNGDGRPGQVWRTEVNTYRADWAGKRCAEANCEATDPRAIKLFHEMGARWLLRELIFCGHKGETTHNVFHAQNRDDFVFGVLPSTYFDALDAAGGLLTDSVRAAVGPQVEAVGRVTARLRSGKSFDVARKVEVDELVEHDPRLVFKGNGTRANPDRFNRDDFAILPFQIDERTFDIAFYVVTHDISAVWRPELDFFDPLRYTMPEQTFDITFENICGNGATVSVWDPATDTEEAVELIEGDDDSIKVRVSSVDYPRFLRIVEKRPGPMLSNVSFARDEDGVVSVTFTGNLKGKAEITCGPFPNRGDNDAVNGFGYEVTVKPGKPKTVRLPGAIIDTDAISIEYEANDLEMRWPQWKHDIRGILKYAIEGQQATANIVVPVLSSPAVMLPELPDAEVAKAMKIPANREIEMRGAKVEVKVLDTPAADASKLLPTLAVTDTRRVSIAEWNGRKAWKIALSLDPAMHPGEKLIAREYWMAPLASGIAFASFQSRDPATLDPEAISAILSKCVFE